VEERFEKSKVKIKGFNHKGHEVHEGKSKEKKTFVSFVVKSSL
jgi:hypothetical protein